MCNCETASTRAPPDGKTSAFIEAHDGEIVFEIVFYKAKPPATTTQLKLGTVMTSFCHSRIMVLPQRFHAVPAIKSCRAANTTTQLHVNNIP